MKKSNQSFQWNKVTPLSKYLAMVLFITLPFIGFVIGMKYQSTLILSQQQESYTSSKQKPTQKNQNTQEYWVRTLFPTNFSTDNWKTYTNGKLKFKYPPQLGVCSYRGVVHLVNDQEVKNICPPGTNNFSKNLVATKLHKPQLFVTAHGLPVPVISGKAMGSAMRFIFANFEYEEDRVVLEMHISGDNFDVFYQALSTATFF